MAEQKTVGKQEKDYEHIIRVMNTDLEGGKSINMALGKIHGIGVMFANAVCSIAKIDKTKKAGKLSDDEVNKLNDIIADPLKFKLPVWMLNRKKDSETGDDKHLVSGDLKFSKDNDIKMKRKMKSYEGTRHSSGLPCRGQRTKSNFRKSKSKGKGALGVKRKVGAKPGK